MSKVARIQITEIINLYHNNGSIIETAKAAGISTVKVRKILITEGLWESETSVKVGNLLRQGLSTEEIAKQLFMSIKNVQAYMPYERGTYGGKELTTEAIRSSIYRKRMKQAASMQVVKKEQDNDKRERIKEMRKQMRAEDNQDSRLNKVLKLQFELNMKYVDEEEMRILKKYASVENSISREVVVPGDITLHGLNYAILRMFGWQNGHLHNFKLPEKVFEELTENRFAEWAKMAGVYFRFPTENYDDIYWDDDYSEKESVKTWMRRKYTGPYKYKGYGEHYLLNQREVQDFFSRYEEITVDEFDFRQNKQNESYRVRLKDATIYHVMNAFIDVVCYELLERLPLKDILCVQGAEKVDYAKVRQYIDSEISKINVDDAVEEYEITCFRSRKQEQVFLEQYNTPTLPIADHLIYSYDYGDGWEVRIRCDSSYTRADKGNWTDMHGEIASEDADILDKVLAEHRPICIQKDGIELVDDVGGIGGFCRMLQTIYESDMNDEEELEERDAMLSWARMMGWTGRKIHPRQIL